MSVRLTAAGLADKLFGRDAELQSLQSTAAAALQGRGRAVVLAGGRSGVGKTALLEEGGRRLALQGALTVSGKFDPGVRGAPYSALADALNALALVLQTERETTTRDRDRMPPGPPLECPGALYRLAPALETLPGARPARATTVASEHARGRFELAVEAFLASAAARRPLVLLLDDLQWAEPDALQLLERLAAAPSLAGLTLLLGYRNEEPSGASLAARLAESARSSGAAVLDLTLPPLGPDALESWFAAANRGSDAAPASRAALRASAAAVHERTGGYPLDVIQFVQCFGEELSSHRAPWPGSDALIQSFQDSLARLATPVQRLLGAAARLGELATPPLLAAILEQTPADVRAVIDSLSGETLSPILPTRHGSDALPIRFRHDQIRAAAAALMPESEVPRLHRAALLWLQAFAPEGERKVLALADCANRAVDALSDPDERRSAAEWNLAAAGLAAESAAFHRALEYCRAGLLFLPAPPAERALRFALAMSGAEAAAHTGDAALAETLLGIAGENRSDLADGARFADLCILNATRAGDFRAALAIAREALANFRIALPRAPSLARLGVEISLVRIALRLRGPRRLLRAPAESRPETNAPYRLLLRAAGAAGVHDPALMVYIVAAGLRRMLAGELNGYFPVLLIGLAMILSAGGKYRAAESYGRLARAWIERHADPAYRGLVQYAFAAAVGHWRRPLAASADRLHAATRVCIDSGAAEYAAYARSIAWFYEFFAGRPPGELAARMREGSAELDRWNHSARLRTEQCLAALELLSGAELWPPRPDLVLYDPVREAAFAAQRDQNGVFFTHFFRGLAEYHLGEAKTALEHLQAARKSELLVANLHFYPRLYFYLALAAVAAYLKHPERRNWREAILSARKLDRIARRAPENCAHLALLARSEIERMRGRYLYAMDAAAQAAELGQAGGFLLDAGLARALAAESALAAAQPQTARLYLEEARRLYEKTGARALLERSNKRMPTAPATETALTANQASSADLGALLEAARVASGAGALRDLLAPGFRIILDNAGAEYGALILAERNAVDAASTWRLIVYSSSDGEAILFPPRSFRDQLAPARAVERCLAGGVVVDLENPDNRSQLKAEPFYQRHPVAAALCLPLLRQGGARGALFLASRQPGAFQHTRRDVATSLAAQLLLAAENAALYEKQRSYEREIELEKLKSSFFASISHEFRTPLTLILAPLESLIQAAKPENELRHLLVIRKNALALLRLMNNLLDAALAEEGRLRAELRPLDLSGLVRELASLFQEAARARSTTIEVRLPAEPLPALADPTLLERALLNLIGNAVKFTDSGRIIVSAVALKDAVRISVQDTGAGVPAEKQSQLFHRYPLGARAARKGAGLGLYLTRLIVDLHGGALRHNAPPAGGAEFIIDLKPAPAGAELEQPELLLDRYYAEALGSDALGPEPVAPPESTASADPERPRLLIVEDEPELSAALIQLFSDRYVVVHAENGRRGYDVALQFGPDAVVADVLMPESSGLEMLERMRASESLRGTPVLLLTARADAASRRRGLDLGAEDYVAKPFDPRELELRVRNLVERKRRAKNALDQMRERMFADFHDYLGAPLTDLNHIVDRLEREGGLPAERLEQLREAVRRTHWSFRNLLETSDDLRILERDFLYGLHLTLLRRYAALNREFRLSIDPDLSRSLQGASLAGLKATLHVTALEITTNDLKYGDGPSTWEIRTAEDDSEMLELAMEAATRYAAEPGRRGRGGGNIVQRAAEIGGTATLRVENGRFYARIRLPLDARARTQPGR